MVYINAIVKASELTFYNDFGVTTLSAKQFDTGRKFIFYIIDNDEPFNLTGCNVYLRIAKADGTQFQGHECCTIDGSSITIDTSVGNGEQILSVPGINKCELHITDENGVGVTTWNFNIYVEARVHNCENISSINSYDVLDNMINMEKNRIENEQIRIDNETVRVKNEAQRISGEIERQKNESERQKTFGNVLDKAKFYVSTASICAFNAMKSEYNADTYQKLAVASASVCAFNTLESESWAHGKTGIREEEDVHNSEFYCQQSELHKNESKTILEAAKELLEKATQKVIDVNFCITDDGELMYESDVYGFEINDDGELEYWLVEGGNE